MKYAYKTLDFGCPNDIDPHHFIVNIPVGRKGCVTVTEHFGLLGGFNGVPEREDRVVLSKAQWQKITDPVKRLLNERLAANRLAAGRWKTGDNKVERMLGKELCVLAWAIESTQQTQIPTAVHNWLGFKPEERWWLYSMTAASAGKAEQQHRGWRKALMYALLDDGAETFEALSERPITTAYETLSVINHH